MTPRRRTIFLAALLLLAASMAATPAARAQEPFTYLALPDTQFYSESYPEIFSDQTQWVADNADAENIIFASHLGDIVQHGNNDTQWQRADTAMSNLDGTVPYGAAIGNHDLDSLGGDRGTKFRQNFGAHRFQSTPGYGAHSADELNSYFTFQGGGREYLSLHLDLDVPDAAMAWAQDVLDAHPQTPTILNTHVYLDRSSGREQAPYARSGGNSAEEVWRELVSVNPQIFMTLNGHWNSERLEVDTNVNRQKVWQIQVDYQSRSNGGNGWLQMYTFDPAQDQIQVSTYSPWLDQYETDANSQYAIDVNFEDRFSLTPPPPTEIVVFDPSAGYAGARDTRLAQAAPDTSYAAAEGVTVDAADAGGASQVLLRFEDLVGCEAGQIPPCREIFQATLELTTFNPGDGATVHRMLTGWQDTQTWNDLLDGVQADGIEAVSEADAIVSNPEPGTTTIDVTESLRAWAEDGEDNFGWVMLPTGSDGWDFYTADSVAPPVLNVEYVIPEPATIGIIGAGLAGLLARRRRLC